MSAEKMPDLSQLVRPARFGGVITTAELLAGGLTDARIRTMIRRGVLVPVCRGVYARGDLAGRPPDRRQPHSRWSPQTQLSPDEQVRYRRMVAIAAQVALAGPAAVASHHDAATVHRLALLDPMPPEISVSRPPGAPGSRTRRPGVRLHPATLPAGHVTVRYGIPVTSVARTVVDLARESRFAAGVVTADSALNGHQTSQHDLGEVVLACPRWRGTAQARRVVAFSDPLAESPLESISRVAFREGGLPPPMTQVWIEADGAMVGRVDFLWYDHATIAEADGAMKYADSGRARKQLRRDAELRAAGYEVVHFTWRDIVSTPAQVIQSIRTAFARAARLRRPAG